MAEPERTAPVVTGEIVIGAAIAPFDRGTAYVCLEDVSRAGAPAEVLLEAVLPGMAHPQGGDSPGRTVGGETRVPFVLEAGPGWQPPDPRHDYALRVRIELAGETRGSLYSRERAAVLTRGHGDRVTLRVEPGGTE